MKDKLAAISKTFLFKDTPEDKLELVAEIAEEKFYHSGDTIFREGDFGGELFIIVSGSVKVGKTVKDERQELARLESGEVFGEISIVDEMPRSATVQANEPTTLLAIKVEDLECLFVDQPELTAPVFRAFSKVLAARLRETTKDATFLRELVGKK